MGKGIALLLLMLSFSVAAVSQGNSLSGEIIDENGSPLVSSTVVLLNPSDSTMQYFGVSGTDGKFAIRNIRNGEYLMQVAFIGFTTLYKTVGFPADNNGNLGYIPLSPKTVSLDEVTVTGERIPMSIRDDTIEYDAKAFKVKPDGVVEDLLKKMPGIEVDRAGNIKALGEDVRNVLVDGKEFFSNDPKVATKNLPADAIDKVQLYNKKSEESEFTGIEDGSRNQTLNLMLDEDKKDGVFGDLMVGGATGNHYQASGKIYRFSEKNQIAALGMMNNVNKFGFSIGDYLSFTGGIAKISHGEGGATMGQGGFPINFGETIAGYSSSGAAGFNFSHSKSKTQRAFFSYIGNGSKRELNENTRTTLYRETGSFFQEENSSRILRDTSHTVNFGIRNLFRESNNIIINGNVSLNTGFVPLTSSLESYQDDILVNSLTRVSSDLSDRISGNITGTYLKRINEGKTIFKITGGGSISSSNSETRFENQADYYDPLFTELVSQFQENTIKSGNYTGTASFTQKIKGPYYADIYFKAGNSSESLARRQVNSAAGDVVIDSLSPDFTKDNPHFGPGITLRRNIEKSTFSLGLEYNFGSYKTTLRGETPADKSYGFIQPRLGWEYEYKTGRRLMVSYSTRTNIPSVSQLMPVVNNFNTLSLFYGNQELEPEYIHSANINWWIFDQFSFTSLLSSARISYTKNKINYSRSVDDNLLQTLRLVNVESDLTTGATVDFSTPVRRLGIKVNLSLDENYNRGINIVNETENVVTNLTHRASVTFDNRRKEKWDVNTGVGVSYTDARYSIQEDLNNTYYDLSWFGEIRYSPSDRLNFNVTADVTNYTASNFYDSRVVPLIGSEITWLFLKNNRAALSLAGVDLLNRNSGIQRVAEMNYLQEQVSNIIGRYVMLSFKWRLNKFGGGDSGIHVDIKRR